MSIFIEYTLNLNNQYVQIQNVQIQRISKKSDKEPEYQVNYNGGSTNLQILLKKQNVYLPILELCTHRLFPGENKSKRQLEFDVE